VYLHGSVVPADFQIVDGHSRIRTLFGAFVRGAWIPSRDAELRHSRNSTAAWARLAGVDVALNVTMSRAEFSILASFSPAGGSLPRRVTRESSNPWTKRARCTARGMEATTANC